MSSILLYTYLLEELITSFEPRFHSVSTSFSVLHVTMTSETPRKGFADMKNSTVLNTDLCVHNTSP